MGFTSSGDGLIGGLLFRLGVYSTGQRCLTRGSIADTSGKRKNQYVIVNLQAAAVCRVKETLLSGLVSYSHKRGFQNGATARARETGEHMWCVCKCAVGCMCDVCGVYGVECCVSECVVYVVCDMY